MPAETIQRSVFQIPFIRSFRVRGFSFLSRRSFRGTNPFSQLSKFEKEMAVIFLTEDKKREPRPEKVAVVDEFMKKVQSSKSAVVTGYSGLTVEEVTDLRAKLFHAKVEYHVVKNNLARIALNKANVTVLDDLLVGPTAIALAMEDAVAPARVLSKFAKDHDKLSLKGGFMDGKLITVQDIKAMANLPSREVLLAKMLGSMQSPITGFVRVLAGPASKLVYALNAIAQAKGKTA